MDWNVPFVIYRINSQGQLEEVFLAHDLKSAKYWLTYLALPGDVLCKTPLHPKHSREHDSPEYWSHKDHSREPMISEKSWQDLAQERNCDGKFPNQQLSKEIRA